MNRGNRRERIFHSDQDYDAFLAMLRSARDRFRCRVVAGAFMPNHFHLVLQTTHDDDLGRFFHLLLTSHVVAYRRHYGTEGRIWQGRYKAFPVQTDGHLVAVMRYVERNPVAAGLATRAQDWRWSTAAWRAYGVGIRPDEAPIELPSPWLSFVDKPMSREEHDQLQRSMQRGTPFGSEDWIKHVVQEMHLESSIRPRGRQPNASKSECPLFSEIAGLRGRRSR
jgi:putative transposase